MLESTVRKRLDYVIGNKFDLLWLSNPTGLGVVGDVKPFRPGAEKTIVYKPRWQAFGLGSKPGKKGGGHFPDKVGCRTITVTPDMVGMEIAVFFGVEIKRPGGVATPEQIQKISLLRSMGAFAGVAHNVEEAEKILMYDRF